MRAVDGRHRTAIDRTRHHATATAQSAAVPLPAAIAALVLSHLFDLVSFLVMTGRHGLSAEANPVVVRLAEQLGLPGLTLAKVVAVVLGASVFVILAPKRRRLAMTVLVFGVVAGLVGGVSNLASL